MKEKKMKEFKVKKIKIFSKIKKNFEIEKLEIKCGNYIIKIEK